MPSSNWVIPNSSTNIGLNADDANTSSFPGCVSSVMSRFNPAIFIDRGSAYLTISWSIGA